MRLPPREATAEGDLTMPFQQSALKSTADQDPLFQHIKIRYVKTTDPPAQVHFCFICTIMICYVKNADPLARVLHRFCQLPHALPETRCCQLLLAPRQLIDCSPCQHLKERPAYSLVWHTSCLLSCSCLVKSTICVVTSGMPHSSKDDASVHAATQNFGLRPDKKQDLTACERSTSRMTQSSNSNIFKNISV